MSSNDRHRVSKRWHQACENCRRKKTRCPGERPACSTCSRLYQVCRYGDESVLPTHSEKDNGKNIEGRLAQLEEKMELMLERAIPKPPSQDDTSHSSGRGPSRTHQLTPTAPSRQPPVSAGSEPLPSRDVIVEIIGLYFQYCHRQPLWLFEREELSSPETLPEEVIFSLLALATRFSTRECFMRQSQELSQRYAEVARGHVMFRIAQGAVQLSTIQSLCLLSFSNFVAQDTHLAWFHISLANSLSTAADMDIEKNSEVSSPGAEAKRKVFYSIYLLNQLYAPRSMILNMLDDIENPRYMEPKRDPSRESGRPPPLTPHDLANITQIEREGIWTYMVQQSSLWREVRGYVAQCADGNPKPPWSPDSGYAVIEAHLMDVETRFPTYHRYDAVRFLDRSKEELQNNRDYWSPWLYLQFAYHAIHSMLNHPFLYSSRPHQSTQLSVPNTFWKTSSELALLHSTWTARLIDMVWEKDYRVSDPFIGYCTAIAATIHIYYCRAADIRVRTSAQNKLAKCMRFVDELGTVWPVCQWMYDRLDALVQSAFKSTRQSEELDASRRTVSINTSLMWDILDYTCPKPGSHKSGRGIFDPAFINDPTDKGGGDNDDNDDAHTVETQIFHRPNPAAEVDTSNGGQEFPPFSDAAVRRNPGRVARGRTGHSAPADERSALQQHQQDTLPAWPGTDMLENSSVMDISYDPFFQFQDQGSQYTGFWEIGNL